MRLFLLPIRFSSTGYSCIWHVFISICSLTKIIKSINWEILAKHSIDVYHKHSIDVYHRCILPRYVLLFCFGNLNSCDYHGDCCSVMFSQFLNCFLPFPLVFLHVSHRLSMVFFGVSLVSQNVSPVSHFRFCNIE